MNNIDHELFAKAIGKRNFGKAKYVLQFEDNSYVGALKLNVKTVSAAMITTNPDLASQYSDKYGNPPIPKRFQ